MLDERESERRQRLRELGEELISISEDDGISVKFVSDEFRASYCSNCRSYADDVIANISVTFER